MLKKHKNIEKNVIWGVKWLSKYKKILRVQRKWLILLNLYKYFLKDMHIQDNIH